MCEERSLKFKGKTKAQLKELLSIEVVVVNDDAIHEDLTTLTVKALKEKCSERGLSKYGTKTELIKRLESKTPEGLTIMSWNKRGRKHQGEIPINDIEDDDDEDATVCDDDSAYTMMKKHELRELCMNRNLPASGTVKVLVKRLEESDALKKKVSDEQQCPEKYCESCENNPN